MSFRRLAIAFSVSICIIYAGLIVSLFYFFQGPLFFSVLFSARTLYSLGLSVVTATVVTVCSVFFALPSAYALSRYSYFGKQVIDTLLELPMIVSPVALGAMILIFLNTPPGQLIQDSAHLIFTIYGILAAQFITTVGVATRLIKAVFDEIPRRYEELAWTLGQSDASTFFKVVVPMGKHGIMMSSILTWAKALGEFGATLTVAGSMAFKTETVPIAIYMRLSSADIEGTSVLVLILISIGLGVLFGVRLLASEKTYMGT